MIERKTLLAERDGDWHCVELTLRGEMADSAAIIAMLSAEGVAVGRFERLAPSLADLLERVVAGRSSAVRHG